MKIRSDIVFPTPKKYIEGCDVYVLLPSWSARRYGLVNGIDGPRAGWNNLWYKCILKKRTKNDFVIYYDNINVTATVSKSNIRLKVPVW